MSLRANNSNSATAELRVRYSGPELTLGVLDRCVLAVFREQLFMSNVFHLQRTFQELRSEQPGIKLGLLNLVEPDVQLPANEDQVHGWSDMLKRNEGTLVGSVVAYNRDGFWSACMRSQVMAINAESKAGIPSFVTPSLEAAASWLAEVLGAGAPPALAIIAAVERLRNTRPSSSWPEAVS